MRAVLQQELHQRPHLQGLHADPGHAGVDDQVDIGDGAPGRAQGLQRRGVGRFAQGQGQVGFQGRRHLLGKGRRQLQDRQAQAGRAQFQALRHGGHPEPVHALGLGQARHRHGAVAVGVGLHRHQHHPVRAHRLADGAQIGLDVAEMDARMGLIEHQAYLRLLRVTDFCT